MTRLPDRTYAECMEMRHVLDFDFEKLCSMTLSGDNVYCDLVDGKFFQGRGKETPAYRQGLKRT